MWDWVTGEEIGARDGELEVVFGSKIIEGTGGVAQHWAIRIDGTWYEVPGASKEEKDAPNTIQSSSGEKSKGGAEARRVPPDQPDPSKDPPKPMSCTELPKYQRDHILGYTRCTAEAVKRFLLRFGFIDIVLLSELLSQVQHKVCVESGGWGGVCEDALGHGERRKYVDRLRFSLQVAGRDVSQQYQSCEGRCCAMQGEKSEGCTCWIFS